MSTEPDAMLEDIGDLAKKWDKSLLVAITRGKEGDFSLTTFGDTDALAFYARELGLAALEGMTNHALVVQDDNPKTLPRCCAKCESWAGEGFVNLAACKLTGQTTGRLYKCPNFELAAFEKRAKGFAV